MYSRVLVLILSFNCLTFYAENLQAQSNYQAQISELEQRILSSTDKLSAEKKLLNRYTLQLAKAEIALRETEVELAQAKRKAVGNDSAADRELNIVSVRYNRHSEKVQRFEERVNETQKTIDELEKAIERSRGKRSELSRQQASNAKKAAIAQEKKQENNVELAKLTKPLAQEKPLRQQQEIKPLPKVEQEPEPADWPHLSTASITDIRFARSKINSLEANRNKAGKQPISNVKLEGKSSFGSSEMKYLGENLYSLVEPVKAGYQEFVIFNQKIWVDIPKADNNALYRFIFDVSSTSKPRLVMFRNDLLEG